MHPTFCDYLVELVHNAFEAGADRVDAELSEPGPWMGIEVSDNGPGMSAECRREAQDAFVTDPAKHAHRKVGLGLAFLRQLADQTGGELALESSPARGARIRCRIPPGHWDAPPVGDVAGTAAQLMAYAATGPWRGAVLAFHRRGDADGWSVTSEALAEAAGPLESAGAQARARLWLESQEKEFQQNRRPVRDGGGAAPAARGCRMSPSGV